MVVLDQAKMLFDTCHTEYPPYGWPYYGWWDFEIYKGYLIATTTLDNFDFIKFLDDPFGVNNQNLTKFGSYSGFEHSFLSLRKFVDDFLSKNQSSDINF